ncbi:MAG: glycine--tRNA ligase subunit beta [Deltaproteobacteria bacterium]|nr:MAG: glycine--tRNA ligase subunit beta [Deltaproteobacteria bacterium]
MSQLLFEIGTEEVPAGYIQPALDFMTTAARQKFTEAGLHCSGVRTVGTPRRLTLLVDALEERQPDRRVEHLGPAKSVGFDAEGNPTRAAQGFARSKGVSVEALQVVTTDKGEYLMAVEEVRGQETAGLLPKLLEELLCEIPFPKSMRWADTSMAFARPIQWLVVMYCGQVLPLEIAGVCSGGISFGHRFLSPEPFEVKEATLYEQQLAAHKVVVDPRRRRAMVIEEVEGAVRDRGIQGAVPVLDEVLVDLVTNLVEQPFAVCGSFDEKFLQLPDEALVTSMREHQKYFPVEDADGALLPLFVAVNNTRIDDLELAVSGHERVLRARLEDALFFFNKDRETSLASRLDALDGVIFQRQLGTMEAKTERLVHLATHLADLVAPAVKEQVKRSARLAKADLLTEMVGEFPSLQGIMGREYALHDGEVKAVAVGISEQYMPIRAGGDLPESDTGAIVGIADRLDTLAGCFAIGERPTGNKDAFGLRRQAIGLINIIRHRNFSLSLGDLINTALSGYKGMVESRADTAASLLSFIRLRFENDLVSSGRPQEVVEAVTAVGFDDLLDCEKRIAALESLHHEATFRILAGSFKRIRNIVKENTATEVEANLLVEDAEKALFTAMMEVRQQAVPMIEDRDYSSALREMLAMKAPLDLFFDEVMVMAEDETLRRNRLNLLTSLGELVLQVGDISKIHVEREY